MLDVKKTLVGLLSFLGICIGVLFLMYLAIYFWPFLIAAIVAVVIERTISYILKKVKLSRRLVGTVLVILFYVVLAVIIGLVLYTLIGELISISTKVPDMYVDIKDKYENSYKKLVELIDKTPTKITNEIYDFGLDLISKVTDFITGIINMVVSFVMFMPKLMIYIIITFLATLFLVVDRRIISNGIYKILPGKIVKKVQEVSKNCVTSLISFLKAQLIMISITFVELLIAFVLLKIKYPITLAVIVALVDALPILGTGTVLIPWAIISAVSGNLSFGIWLLIAYVVITVVRQLTEPRIVSKKIGVHPFVTLLSMYLGFKLLGFIGMIVGPVMMVIYKNVFASMFEAGFFKKMFIYKDNNIEK